jgi:hypothetical protein
MKPKPFASLNHFTRPVGMAVSWLEKGERYHGRWFSFARRFSLAPAKPCLVRSGTGKDPFRGAFHPISAFTFTYKNSFHM